MRTGSQAGGRGRTRWPTSPTESKSAGAPEGAAEASWGSRSLPDGAADPSSAGDAAARRVNRTASTTRETCDRPRRRQTRPPAQPVEAGEDLLSRLCVCVCVWGEVSHGRIGVSDLSGCSLKLRHRPSVLGANISYLFCHQHAFCLLT